MEHLFLTLPKKDEWKHTVQFFLGSLIHFKYHKKCLWKYLTNHRPTKLRTRWDPQTLCPCQFYKAQPRETARLLGNLSVLPHFVSGRGPKGNIIVTTGHRPGSAVAGLANDKPNPSPIPRAFQDHLNRSVH